LGGPCPQHRERDLVAGLDRAELGDELLRGGGVLTVERGDHVTGLQGRRGRGASRHHLQHDDPGVLAHPQLLGDLRGEGGRLDTDVGVLCGAGRQQLVSDGRWEH